LFLFRLLPHDWQLIEQFRAESTKNWLQPVFFRLIAKNRLNMRINLTAQLLPEYVNSKNYQC